VFSKEAAFPSHKSRRKNVTKPKKKNVFWKEKEEHPGDTTFNINMIYRLWIHRGGLRGCEIGPPPPGIFFKTCL
jgi:hypothetical protein